MRRFSTAAVAALLVLAATGAGLQATAHADGTPAGQLVRDTAAARTPHLLDGQVNGVVQVGNTMVVAGTFTQARNDDETQVQSQPYLMAFDATTGRIRQEFQPNANGMMWTVTDAGDGETVYVGGQFTEIGGTTRNRVARIRVSDGSVVESFNAGTVSGQVRDLALKDGRLWVAGVFTHIANGAQAALATLDPDTGSRLPYMRLSVTGFHRRGNTQVLDVDLSPDGKRLVAVGNFRHLEGVHKQQVFMLDLSGDTAQPADWQTNFYTDPCSSSFDSVMRQVSFSPTGEYFAITTTGAYGGATSSCDSIARFDTAPRGSALPPTWVDLTGGDTSQGVLATDEAVYVGGHFRWMNNPFRGDSPGQGAVAREGLTALDPVNGLPLTWNPGRTKGVGVFAFLRTDAGLWIGSDTDRIANYQYKGRIARMPADGVRYPAVRTPQVPNDVYGASEFGWFGWGSNAFGRRAMTPSSVAPPQTLAAQGVDWASIRGAFMVNGYLYTGLSNGSFVRRSYDGTTFGPAEPVDTADRLTTLSDWRNDVSNMTGMFFDRGRIYFTRASDNNLYYRYFTPQSGTVGATRSVASGSVTGFSPANVKGMFSDGEALYWADSQARLYAVDWRQDLRHGVPVPGTARQVSGPGKDSSRWENRAYWLFQDAHGNGAVNVPPPTPTAAFTSTCEARTCMFDAASSHVATGSVTGYEWDFDGEGTSTVRAPQFTFADEGTQQVRLTVTTAAGATATVTHQVTTTAPPVGSPEFVDVSTSTANATQHRVTVPAGVRAGDTLLLTAAVNTTAATVTPPAGWTELESVANGSVRAVLWTRQAEAGDAGGPVTVALSGTAKADVVLSAYRSAHGGTRVLASAGVTIDAASDSYTAPTLTTTAPAVQVSYFAGKSSSPIGWLAPAGREQRTLTEGTGGGRMAGTLLDTGSPVPAGDLPGATATASGAVTKGAMFSIAVGVD